MRNLKINIAKQLKSKSLKLTSEKLTCVPESLRSNENLEKLILNNTQITYLPEWIGALKNLKELDLYCNKLTSIPESIGNLNKLTYLCLGYNELTSLPLSVCMLEQSRKQLYIYALGNNFLETDTNEYLVNFHENTAYLMGEYTIRTEQLDKIKIISKPKGLSIREYFQYNQFHDVITQQEFLTIKNNAPAVITAMQSRNLVLIEQLYESTQNDTYNKIIKNLQNIVYKNDKLSLLL